MFSARVSVSEPPAEARLSEGRERTHSLLGGDRTRDDGPPPAGGSDAMAPGDRESRHDSFAMAQILAS